VTTTAAAVVAAVAALAALGWWLRRRYALVEVDGASMEPAYTGGDRVVVRRVPAAALRTGDAVVVERPTGPGRWSGPPGRRVTGRRWMIKRVAALPGEPVPPRVHAAEPVVPPGRMVVLGDNPAASYDSRGFGYLPAERLLGVVVRRVRRR
jgi:signal peptidase I